MFRRDGLDLELEGECAEVRNFHFCANDLFYINIIEVDVQPKLSDVDGEDVHIMNGTGTAKKTPPHHGRRYF